MKIVILIRSLEVGGAQCQVAVLAKGLKEKGHDVQVWVFYHGGAFQREVENAGVPIVNLGKSNRWEALRFFTRLVLRLRRSQPDVLYAFLSVSNLLAILAKPFVRNMKPYLSLRTGDVKSNHLDRLGRILSVVERMVSGRAEGIIANSRAGKRFAVASGYPAEKIFVVPNGINHEKYRFEASRRESIRAEFRIPSDTILIGTVGRLSPVKGHPMLLQAIAAFIPRHPEVRFLIVGGGVPEYEAELKGLAAKLNLGDHVIWAGERTEVPAFLCALDVFTLSSKTEGFPNALAEAMSTGLPCVVTDVGDCAWLLGDGGIPVPWNPSALAEGWERALSLDRLAMGKRNRLRIETTFSIQACIDATDGILGARADGGMGARG